MRDSRSFWNRDVAKCEILVFCNSQNKTGGSKGGAQPPSPGGVWGRQCPAPANLLPTQLLLKARQKTERGSGVVVIVVIVVIEVMVVV